MALLSVAASMSLLVATACSDEQRKGVEGLGEVLTALQREQLSFSVLAVNIQGNHPDHGDDTAGWIERQSRIAGWMAATDTRPDVIALQEVHGRSGDVMSYEMLFRLVSSIAARTGVSYRIANLVVRPVPQGLRPTLWPGTALLYNPNRLTNRTVARPGDVPLPYTDETTLGVHLRKSLACQDPPAEFQESCALIDGDGLAGVSSFRDANGRWQPGPVFARLQLKAFPGLFLHLYNTHVQWQPGETNAPAMFLAEVNRLIPQMEGSATATRLYPPIVLGDFNLGEGDVLTHYPSFQIAGYASREVMGVLMGTPDAFPAKHRARFEPAVVPEDLEDPATRGTSSCGRVGVLWSDHCGVFVQFRPA